MREEDLINTRLVLESYGEQTLNTMRNVLISSKKDATGTLIQSLGYTIDYNGDSLDIEFSMVDYGQFVDKGRRPGKQPPISAISNWARIKGISQNAVYPIARKIGRIGIAPTPFFGTSIEAGKEQLLKDLERAMTQDIDTWLQKQIQNNF